MYRAACAACRPPGRGAQCSREVQANRTAERHGRRRRAKTDAEDAEAITRETLADPGLPPAAKNTAVDLVRQELTAIRDWRKSLVLQRVRLLNEAEAVLVGLPIDIRSVLPKTSRVLPQLRALVEHSGVEATALAAADQIKLERLRASLDDITTLTSRIKHVDAKIPTILTAIGSTLTVIHGIGAVTAMDLLAEIGDPRRFSTEAQFARWCGAAPVAISSGEGHGPARRHRLDLGGNRDVNSLLHAAVTNANSPTSSSDTCGPMPAGNLDLPQNLKPAQLDKRASNP